MGSLRAVLSHGGDGRGKRHSCHPMADPLILTLRLDDETTLRFENDRQVFFPRDRNVVPAHVTLFNRLPGEEVDQVRLRLARIVRETPPPPVHVAEVMALARRGAAYRLEVPGLEALRRRIGAGFELAPQDRGRRKPHVTVQNRVGPEEAERTLATLRARFAPFDGRGVGLDLWWYRGGPWQAAGAFAFTG